MMDVSSVINGYPKPKNKVGKSRSKRLKLKGMYLKSNVTGKKRICWTMKGSIFAFENIEAAYSYYTTGVAQ